MKQRRKKSILDEVIFTPITEKEEIEQQQLLAKEQAIQKKDITK